MKAFYSLLAFAALALLSASAQSASCAVDTAVYFGNGVVTTKEDALRNARITGKAVVREAPSSEGCRFEFKVAYNQSSGLLLDVLEAARQTLGNEYPTLVMAFILQKAGLPNSLFAALLPTGTLAAFNERFRNATVQSLVSGSASAKTLNEHVGLYTNDLQTKRVILLSHSQGNIYGNLAAARLSSQSPTLYARFAIIPVASPEYYCAKSLVGHVRFSDDLIIGAVSIARSLVGLPESLESNDEDGYDVDFWSHYYLEAYYLDDSSRRFIIDGILRTSRLLPGAPSNLVTYSFSGFVTAFWFSDAAFWSVRGFNVNVGTSFSGRMTYDRSVGGIRSVPSYPDFYYYEGALKSFEVTFAGNQTFRIAPPGNMNHEQVWTGDAGFPPQDYMQIWGFGSRNGYRISGALFLNTTHRFLSGSPPLPLVLPSASELDVWPDRTLRIIAYDPGAQIRGQLTSLTRQ